MSRTVSEQWCDQLTGGGFSLLYSLAGECDNTLMETLHREKRFSRRTELQQESAAVLAAIAGERATGKPSVCYAGSFPGYCNTLGALKEMESMSSRLLVLGVTDGEEALPGKLFENGRYRLVQRAEEAASAMAEAIRLVRDTGVPVVLLLREDIAGEPAVESDSTAYPPPFPALPAQPHPAALAEMAALLSASERTVFLCGRGCRGAREEILAVAQRIQAPVAYTLSGKDIMEGENNLGIGMPGIPGWGAAPYAVVDCDVLVLWGTDFSYPELLNKRGKIVQVDCRPEVLGKRIPLHLGLVGDVRRVAQALLPLLPLQENDEFAASMRRLHRRQQTRLESHVRSTDEKLPLRPELLTRMLSDLAEPDAIFCVDAGSPMLWCACYLHPAGQQRMLGSFRIGLKECALPMGVGAKAAYPSRQVIAVCTAEGVLKYMSELLTLQREYLSLKILVFRRELTASGKLENSVPGMRENGDRILSVAELARQLGIQSFFVQQPGLLHRELRRWLAEPGPALLEAGVDAYALQVPPDMLVYGDSHHQATHPFGRSHQFLRSIYGNKRFYQ